MTEEQIERAYVSYLNIPEKTMKEDVSPREDLTFNQFKALLTFKNVHYNDDTFEVNYSLRSKEGWYNYIAYLVSDQNDTSIKVVRFNGVTKADFISRKEFETGCIFKQMEDALEYALNVLNIVQTNIIDGERIDTPYFDEIAFREAWFNAVCHNLWVEHIPPAIYGFDDRVEIISQGILKKGMTQEEFFSGISKPVNEEFSKIFMQMHYMEQSGRGVPTIVARYGKGAYRFGSSFIECVIPYNILDKEKQARMKGKILEGENATVNAPVNAPVKLNNTEQLIIELMRNNPYVTIEEMARILGKDRRTITRNLAGLKRKGLIERGGADKTGMWIVK